MNAGKRLQSLRSHSGFTLIELLVVISIIALLLAILLPAISKALSHARAVACSADMHSIGQATLGYASSQKSHAPGRAVLQNSVPDWYPWAWVQILNKEYFADDVELGYSWFTCSNHTIRWIIAPGNFPEQLCCTEYKGDEAAPSVRAFQMNQYLADAQAYPIGNPINGHVKIYESMNHPDYKIYHQGVNIDFINDHSRTILHTEGQRGSDFNNYEAPSGLILADDLGYCANSSGTSGVDYRRWAFRHDMAANVLFLDGHVQKMVYSPATDLNTPARFGY